MGQAEVRACNGHCDARAAEAGLDRLARPPPIALCRQQPVGRRSARLQIRLHGPSVQHGHAAN